MRASRVLRAPMGINAVGQLAGKSSKAHNAETISKLGKATPEAVSRSAARGHEVIAGVAHPQLVAKQVVSTAEAKQRQRLAAIRAAAEQKRSPTFLAEEKGLEGEDNEGRLTEELEELERINEINLLLGSGEAGRLPFSIRTAAAGQLPRRGFASLSAADAKVKQRHAHHASPKKPKEAGKTEDLEETPGGTITLEPEALDIGAQQVLVEYSSTSDVFGAIPELGEGDAQWAASSSQIEAVENARNQQQQQQGQQEQPRRQPGERFPPTLTAEERREAEALLARERESASVEPFGERDSHFPSERDTVEREIQKAEAQRDGDAFQQEAAPFATRTSGNRFGGTHAARPNAPPRRNYGVRADGRRWLTVKRVEVPGAVPAPPRSAPEPPSLSPQDPSPAPQSPLPSPPKPPSSLEPDNKPERTPQPPPPPSSTTVPRKVDGSSAAFPFGFTALARTSASEPLSSSATSSIDELFEREDNRGRRNAKVAKALLFPTNSAVPAGEADYKETVFRKRGSARGMATARGKDQASFYYGHAQSPDTDTVTTESLFPRQPMEEKDGSKGKGKGGVMVSPGLGARRVAAALDFLPLEGATDSNGTTILPANVLTASFEELPEDVGTRRTRAGNGEGVVPSLSEETELELEEGLGVKAAASSLKPLAVIDAEEKDEAEGEVENAVPAEALKQRTQVRRDSVWSSDSAANTMSRMDLADLTEDRSSERGRTEGFVSPLDFPSPTTSVDYQHGPQPAHPPSSRRGSFSVDDNEPHPPHHPSHRHGIKRGFATKAGPTNKRTAAKASNNQKAAKGAPKDETESAVKADAFFVREEEQMAKQEDEATERMINEAEASLRMWEERADNAESAALGDGGGLGLHDAATTNKKGRRQQQQRTINPDLATHLGSEPSRGIHFSGKGGQQPEKTAAGSSSSLPRRLEVPGDAFIDEDEAQRKAAEELSISGARLSAEATEGADSGLSLTQQIHRERRTSFPSTAFLTSRGGIGIDVSKASTQQYKIAAEVAAESLRESGQAVKEEAKAAAHEWQVKERAREVFEAAKELPRAVSSEPSTGVEQGFSLVGRVASLAASLVATVGKALGAGTKVIAASTPAVAKELAEGYGKIAPRRQLERDFLALRNPFFFGPPTSVSLSDLSPAWTSAARQQRAERAQREHLDDLHESDSIGGAEDEATSGGAFSPFRNESEHRPHRQHRSSASAPARPSRGLNGVRTVYLLETFGAADVREAMDDERLANSGRATVEKRRGTVAPRPQT